MVYCAQMIRRLCISFLSFYFSQDIHALTLLLSPWSKLIQSGRFKETGPTKKLQGKSHVCSI